MPNDAQSGEGRPHGAAPTGETMTTHGTQPISVFDPRIVKPALVESFRKLDPRTLWHNPVMFCVEIASFITLVTFIMSLSGKTHDPVWFTGLVSLWLWLTVIFATFAEALAEGRGKARAASLRKTRTEVVAKQLKSPNSAVTTTWCRGSAPQGGLYPGGSGRTDRGRR